MSDVSNLPGQVSTVTAPPLNYELRSPFQVGPDGRLAMMADPAAKAAQHLIDLALTSPGERVMRSNYGIGISRLVFENATLESFTAAAQRLQVAFNTAQSGVNNASVSVAQTVGDRYLFRVRFTLDQSPLVHEALFDYSGHLVGTT